MGKRRVLSEMMGAPVEEAKLRTDIKQIFKELEAAGDAYMDKLDQLLNAMQRVVTKKTGSYNPSPDVKKLRDAKYSTWNKGMAPFEAKIEAAVKKIDKMPEKKS
jgi:hypothetical protein